MIHIEITKEDIEKLDYERYPHPRVQLKMEVLWLKSQEAAHKDICLLANICKTTLCSYLRQYKEGGVEALKKTNFYRPRSKLEGYKTTIEEYFRKNPPASLKEAAARIEELTGIKRDPSRIGKFFKRIGMKYRKVGTIPAKADVEEQERFKREELDPRIKEAQAGKRIIFFVDAAHFVLAPFLGMLWSFTRLFIPSPAGRKRFNVLGALDGITHKLITITNEPAK